MLGPTRQAGEERTILRLLLAVLWGLLAVGSGGGQESGLITIAAVGDVMMGSTYPDASKLPPEDGRMLLAPFSAALHDADITFGNLEGPMLEGGVSTKCGPAATAGSCYAFRVPTRYGAYLEDAGFTVLNLANNHAGDFGPQGRASTRKVLDELGIRHIGSERGKFATTVLTVKGTRVGFIGFAFNDVAPNINDLADARLLVADLKRRADLVVVSFHNGAEGVTHQHVGTGTEMFFGEKRGDPRAFAHAVVDAGADLVLGHGPHVMRGMEVYGGHLIVYSMGNFCTYGQFHLEAETSLTAVFRVRLGLDGRFLDGKMLAGRQDGEGGPTVDLSGAGIAVVRALSVADFGENAPTIADDGSFVAAESEAAR